MKKPKFIVCTPPYRHDSAGVVVLHELCDALYRLGFESYILFMDYLNGKWNFHHPESPTSGFNSALLRNTISSKDQDIIINGILDTGICIYPEIVPGNPLQAKHVARYFLYYDGAITGVKSDHKESEFLIAFHPNFINQSNAVLFKFVFSEHSHDRDAPRFEERSLDLTFFGKGNKYTDCFLIRDSVELPRNWPKSKSELGTLLRRTRYLYTWDNDSSICVDAILCGARPVILQHNQDMAFGQDLSRHETAPYLRGVIDGNSVLISKDEDYIQKRTKFISGIFLTNSSWTSRVNNLAESMCGFFHL
jgi:hypothetical protein